MKRAEREAINAKLRESPERPSKRAIRYKGGYVPPPRFSKEQIREGMRRRDNKVAEAGLKFLNLKMASEGKSEYELVFVHKSAFFRSKLGPMFHGNFVARPSGDPNAEKRLFFVQCKLVHYEAIDCVDLGPADIGHGRGCKLCDLLGMTPPSCHPPGSKIGHGCDLCDAFRPSAPIFHPPGLKTDHLIIMPDPPY
uniref:DUF3615 domain-containing protein n=1 Tax=Opuntia streptacantha TaxID=393608 RepID=A0A7C9CLZ4_OPUST